MAYQVFFMGENVWTLDNKPYVFNTMSEAIKELHEHFLDMESVGMDYEPSDYRIKEMI